MMLHGKPNRELPADMGVDLESMIDGGKQAISVVTGLMQSDQLDQLEGLVSTQCILGLRQSLDQLSAEQKQNLLVESEDIFFTFVPSVQFYEDKQSILLVTFSFPGLNHLKQTEKTNVEELNNTLMDLEKQAKDGKIEPKELKDSLNEKMKSVRENNPRREIFNSNEILIGNYKFERPDKISDWTIVEVSQISSVKAWAKLFRYRWKSRLALSLRGVDFYKILRIDYLTDWFFCLVLMNLILVRV